MSEKNGNFRVMDLAIPVVVALLVIITAQIIEKFNIKIVFSTILLLVVVALISSAMGAAVAVHLIKRKVQPDFEQVRSAVVALAANRSITDDFMAEHEKHCTVCILTLLHRMGERKVPHPDETTTLNPGET